MKTTQHLRQLKAVEAADTNLIREWWMFGLRLLRDQEIMSPSGLSLRHGETEKLIHAAGRDAKGRPRLSAQKIQRAIRCARTYQTESQIRRAATDFDTWSDLVDAGFPPYPAEEGEPPADHRTDRERDEDHHRALLDLVGDQGALFPLRDFEPVVTTLKDLQEYTAQQEELTARFVAHGKKRRDYLNRLIAAADNDLSVTWQEAHDRLGLGDIEGLDGKEIAA